MDTSIVIEAAPSAWILRCEGALTAASAATLLQAACSALAGPAIELQCEQVESIDACGLQVLLALQAAAKRAGKELRLRRPSASIVDALALCNLTTRFAQEEL